MPCIIAFIGKHNSGKTTTVLKVLKELAHRGYAAGVLKSTHHEIPFHTPGKDTSLYREAGVRCVAIKGPSELAFFQDIKDESVETTVFRLFPNEDIVILEGFKNITGIPKIEVAARCEPGFFRDIQGVKAVITTGQVAERPVLHPDAPEEVVDFIENTVLAEHMREDEVSIFINNRRLPLKFFIKNAVKGLITGFLKSLKFTEGASRIDIRVVLRQPDSNSDSSL